MLVYTGTLKRTSEDQNLLKMMVVVTMAMMMMVIVVLMMTYGLVDLPEGPPTYLPATCHCPLHSNPIYCIAIYCTSLHCTARQGYCNIALLHIPTIQSTSDHSNAIQWTIMHFNCGNFTAV